MASLKNSIETFKEMTLVDWIITVSGLVVCFGIMGGIHWFGHNIVGAQLMGLNEFEADRGVDVTLQGILGSMVLVLIVMGIKEKLHERKITKTDRLQRLDA